MQRLREGALSGELHKVAAKIQGPIGGRRLSEVDLETNRHLVVFSVGVSAASLLSALQRLALVWEGHHRTREGGYFFVTMRCQRVHRE
jgi:hypothetical protein